MSLYLDIDDETAPFVLNTEETGISRVIEHAWDYLDNALRLWQMIDRDQAVRLKHIISGELQERAESGMLRLRREQVERLAENLQNIETRAVGVIMDKDYHVLPDKIDYVNESAPGLAVRTTDGQGNIIYVLDKITEVEWLRAFLETALRLNIDVIQG